MNPFPAITLTFGKYFSDARSHWVLGLYDLTPHKMGGIESKNDLFYRNCLQFLFKSDWAEMVVNMPHMRISLVIAISNIDFKNRVLPP